MWSATRCSSDEALHAYLQGRLSSREDAATREHLEGCAACRGALERLAGDARSWREAGALLADLDDTGPGAEDDMSGRQDGREALRRAGVDTQLSRWMGPTDDPAKMGRVGAFEVVGIVGIGGAGVVLKAHDARLDRYVALKVLLPALANNAAARQRFEREARAVAAIAHPNVVPIYAVDTYNGLPYIAMQYVGGSSLQQRLDAHGPLRVVEVVRIAAQVARALAAAHAQGVIHRDIKPANILLENNVDRVLVADFGLARVADEAATHSGVITGTPLYMSPEQCHGDPVDRRSDLFSLGSVMYAMCVGRPPFRAETLMGALRRVCEATPGRIRERSPETPEWLESFIGRLMQKSREDRFQDASTVAAIMEAELAHLQNPTAVAAPGRDWMPSQKRAPIPPKMWRRTVMVVAATALGAALLAALAQVDRTDLAGDPDAAGSPTSDATQQPLAARDDENGNRIYESHLERTFDLQPGGLLDVRTIYGDIEVAGGETSQVRVEVFRRVEGAPSEEVARALLDRHRVDLMSEANTVSVRDAKRARPGPPSNEVATLRVRYVITVPSRFDLALISSDGDVDVDGVTGKLAVTSSDGDILLSRSEGEIRAESSDGDVRLSRCEGRISATSFDGEIELIDVLSVPGGQIRAETQDGSVWMRTCRGDISAASSEGTIRLFDCDGTISATSADGSIELKDCDGTLVAMAKDGRVRADNWTGSLVTRSGREAR